MEKISSIVPRSRRVSATDLSASAPVRPGVPGFGRPVGVSTVGEKDLRTTAQKAIAAQDKMNEDKRLAKLTPEIVTDMTDRFFLKKTISAPEVPSIAAPAAGTGAPIGDVGDEMLADGQNVQDAIIEGESAPREYVPPGTYLDISA